jgi:hypothetical protein
LKLLRSTRRRRLGTSGLWLRSLASSKPVEFWDPEMRKAYLSIKQPLTAHGPIHPRVSSRHDPEMRSIKLTGRSLAVSRTQRPGLSQQDESGPSLDSESTTSRRAATIVSSPGVCAVALCLMVLSRLRPSNLLNKPDSDLTWPVPVCSGPLPCVHMASTQSTPPVHWYPDRTTGPRRRWSRL